MSNFKTVYSETAYYGTYEPKEVDKKVRMSKGERAAVNDFARSLGVSSSLLFRVMVKRAIKEYQEKGINPLGDFEVKNLNP